MMRTDETVDVLRRLDAADHNEPPRVDLEAAILTGRRRRRHRRVVAALASVAAVAAVTLAVPVAFHAVNRPPAGIDLAGPKALTCTEQKLALPPAAAQWDQLVADPTGHYIAGAVVLKANRETRAVVAIWHDGTFTTVQLPGYGSLAAIDPSSAWPIGIASNGAMLLQSGVDSTGWVYDAGNLTHLSGPTGTTVSAINDRGMIIGSSNHGMPIMWATATSQPSDLPVPRGYDGADPVAIDSDGTVAGNAWHGNAFQVVPLNGKMSSAERGVIWLPDGSSRVLPNPRGISGVATVKVQTIRNGVVVVDAVVPDHSGSGARHDSHALQRVERRLHPTARC